MKSALDQYAYVQRRSQEFAKGNKRGGLEDGRPPAGSRGRAPVGFWAKPPEAGDTMSC